MVYANSQAPNSGEQPTDPQKQKIEGKFYPLQTEEWAEACRELSHRAITILYFVRSLDPYGSGIRVSTSQMALQLKISRSTISRALQELRRKGYLEVEILVADVRVVGKGGLFSQPSSQPQHSLCNSAPAEEPTEKGGEGSKHPPCAELHSPLQNCTAHCNSAQPHCSFAQPIAKLQQPTPETLAQSGLQIPKTIKTVKTSLECVDYAHAHAHARDTHDTHTVEGEIKKPEGGQEEVVNLSDYGKDNPGPLVTKYDSKLGVNIPGARRGRRPERPEPKFLIPDGPWLNDRGQLDEKFISHTVQIWKKSKGANFHEMADEDVAALVFSHFSRNHDVLAVKWEAFSANAYRHAGNVHQLVAAGIQITAADQEKVEGNARAIAYAATADVDEWAIPIPSLPTLPVAKPAPAPALAPAPAPALPVPVSAAPASTFEGFEGKFEGDGFADLPVRSSPLASPLASPEPSDFTPEEQARNYKRLAEMMNRAALGKRMPAAKERKQSAYPQNLAQAQEWICGGDPILAKAAGEWAERQGYAVSRTPGGQVVEILDF